MLSSRRPILVQFLVTICTALGVVAVYVYLARRPHAPIRPSSIQQALAGPISINFVNAPLEQVFQTFSDRIGVPIDIDWETLEATGFSRDHRITEQLHDVPASRALRTVLDNLGTGAGPVTFAQRDERLLVSLGEHLATPELRLYEVGDLVDEYVAFRSWMPNEPYTVVSLGILHVRSNGGIKDDPQAQGVEELTLMLTSLVGGDSWLEHGGRIGQADYAFNRLIIAQSPENHEQIDRILDALRKRDFSGLAKAMEKRSRP